MLKELYINNIAIIKDERIEPSEFLTVLTGETGAGKSIIIDALGLVMGQRASRELIRSGEEKATVSALFDVLSPFTTERAAALGIESDDGLLFQRDITESGGGTARINGRIVPLSLMRDLATSLINIHGQHGTQSLLDEENHIVFLDAFSGVEEEKNAYRALYDRAADTRKRLAEITRDEKEKVRMIELLKYQINDINAVNPRDGEEEELKVKRTKLQNAEKISKFSRLIYRALYQNEKGFSACDLIEKAENALSELSDVVEGASSYVETLADFRYRIEDIADSVKKECDVGVHNPTELLDKIEERIENIRRIQKKYGGTAEEIRQYRDRMQKKLQTLLSADELIEDLENELAALRAEMKQEAELITKKRRDAARFLEEKITKELVFLDMEKVRFKIEVLPLDDFSADGKDKVVFLVSANPGEPLLPLSKIASGGELSRMMLALKCAFADKEHTETLIFDEIDTGISGKTSHKIGVKLREVAQSGTQVICVTHSPQIAALANAHLFVSKTEVDGRTESSVHTLSRTEREEEIARIIGGAKITKQTLAAARELLSDAEKLSSEKKVSQ